MKLEELGAGETVFLDANVFVYHFVAHPLLGSNCTEFIDRITRGEIAALTASHVVTEAAHRLMVYEASEKFGWKSKVMERLKRQPSEVKKLTAFRDAIEKIPKLGIGVVGVSMDLVTTAPSLSIQYGLLSNDALTVAVMQHLGLTNIASNDTDFDRVPWITRFSPA